MLDSILPNSAGWLKAIQIGGYIISALVVIYASLAGLKLGNMLERELETEKQKVASLEEQQKPRRLTNRRKPHLIGVLAAYTGQEVGVYSRQGDPEAARFADDFVEMFQEAGWKVGRGWIHPIYNFPPPGISLRMRNPKQIPPAAEALMGALKELGIEVVEVTEYDYGPNSFGLMVGQK